MKTLKQWVEEHGDRQAAELFGVAQRTAASWRQGVARPRASTAQRIVAMTGGDVSMNGIYGVPSNESVDNGDREAA